MEYSIYALARELRDNYINDKVDTVEGLSLDTYQTIREIEFMTSGHYLNGDYDEDGNLKPFHDIVTRILENQRSAEEVDTKDMNVTTDDPEYYVRASLISKFNQDWMQAVRIDQFHNDAIEVRGKIGGLLVKVVENSDELSLEVCDWNSFAGDAVDLENGMKLFDHFYTPSQLLEVAQERGWDMDATQEAIELYAEADQDDEMREQRETTGKYILVRELSGVIEKKHMDENAGDHEYSYQVHYIAGMEFQKDGVDQGKTLSSKELDKSPFYYLPYKKRTTTGKTLGIGMVERARHAQIWTNYGAIQNKYALDFASINVLQSASKNLKGKNVLKNVPRGSILKHDDGKPIGNVNMTPASIGVLGEYQDRWRAQSDGATATNPISTGALQDLPATTTYRLGAIADQNSQSSFDLRREEYAIFLNRIYKERIFPWQIRRMRSKKELKLKFSPEELKVLDRDVAQYRAESITLDKLLNGGYDNVNPAMRFAVMDAEQQAIMEGVVTELKRGKNRRTITDFPDGYWDNVADKLYVDITGERRDKLTFLTAIDDLLFQYIQLKPQLDADPQARKLFNQKVEAQGLEPIDFSESAPSPDQQITQQAPPQKPKSALEKPELLSAKPN